MDAHITIFFWKSWSFESAFHSLASFLRESLAARDFEGLTILPFEDEGQMSGMNLDFLQLLQILNYIFKNAWCNALKYF